MLFKSQNSAMTKKLEHSFSRFSVSCISVSLPFVSVLSGSVDEDLLFLALPLGLADHISIWRSVVTSVPRYFLLSSPLLLLSDLFRISHKVHLGFISTLTFVFLLRFVIIGIPVVGD